jgi:3'-phosphoadenosine 5'-phosphosulfate sulfotransferase (PAPS reductase)/FAD synthetase
VSFEFLYHHKKIALELSGGKDSVAVLYLLRDVLDKITVYWLNTGDAYPETVAIIEECKKLCPHFVEVKSNVAEWTIRNGFPSDVVPATGWQVNRAIKDGELKVVDSFTCCAHNVMNPLHDRVVGDGNTCIIRGQKTADEYKAPIVSGEWHDGVQIIFPIAGWTDDEVMDFLRASNAPIHPVYDFSMGGVDCLHCTGWWDTTPVRFLSRHAQPHEFVTAVRGTVKEMVAKRMALC